MLVEQFKEAAATARTMQALDNVAKMAWKALGEGWLIEADAEAVSAAVEARRSRLRAFPAPAAKRPSVSLRKPPTSPDRRASIERRRRVAASGALPPALACHFTMGELAVLSVVARIVRQQGSCDAHIDKLAGVAGVSRSTVKRALRLATRLGLISVTERRRRGQRSDTNLVAILSNEWRTWLRLKGDRGSAKNHHEYELINSVVDTPQMPGNGLPLPQFSRYVLKREKRYFAPTYERGLSHGRR